MMLPASQRARDLTPALQASFSMVLCACCAMMPSTKVACVAIGLWACYAMSGTDLAYGAGKLTGLSLLLSLQAPEFPGQRRRRRRRRRRRSRGRRRGKETEPRGTRSAMRLRRCYALSSTDVGCAATHVLCDVRY
eukprot:2303082-Rhodomonas_salina.3